MLDAPCGDFFWMSQVNLPLDLYIGVDIVPDLVDRNQSHFASPRRQFLSLDVIKAPLPKVDLVLCRHLLIHLPLADCLRVLRNFQRSGSTYLLITHQPAQEKNDEKPTGSFRPVNLRLPPFNLPAPLNAFSDATTDGDAAQLVLYRLSDLALR
jgi:hypothetical protein